MKVILSVKQKCLKTSIVIPSLFRSLKLSIVIDRVSYIVIRYSYIVICLSAILPRPNCHTSF